MQDSCALDADLFIPYYPKRKPQTSKPAAFFGLCADLNVCNLCLIRCLNATAYRHLKWHTP
jgi:hypothetical protein